MISINTEAMRHLVDTCAAANDAIEEAVAALTGITTHDDWGCREKDAINEYTTTNKKKILHIQECSTSFLRVLRSVTQDFESTESSLADMGSTVDASIGPVVQQPIMPAISGVASQLLSSASAQAILNGQTTGGSLDAYIHKSLTDAVSVCAFEDVAIKGVK